MLTIFNYMIHTILFRTFESDDENYYVQIIEALGKYSNDFGYLHWYIYYSIQLGRIFNNNLKFSFG